MKSCGKDLVFTVCSITDVIPRNEKFPRKLSKNFTKEVSVQEIPLMGLFLKLANDTNTSVVAM